jgi:hypothetical protein
MVLRASKTSLAEDRAFNRIEAEGTRRGKTPGIQNGCRQLRLD